ncbi:hypothetical protein GCM10009113_10870 [Marinobacter szutsaonensis]
MKGLIARTYFYIHDRYDLTMSRKQQQLLLSWHKQFPVTEWEKKRDQRIASVMGHHNPFVTGERVWTLGHRNLAEGIPKDPDPNQIAEAESNAIVIGNARSQIYHLPEGCPSYSRVSERNRVAFNSAREAEAAGYRKAGNCRS